MECPTCHFENSAQARFCAGCGARLAGHCPSCGQEVESTARFCQHCGAAIGEDVPATNAESAFVPAKDEPGPFTTGVGAFTMGVDPSTRGAGGVTVGPGPATIDASPELAAVGSGPAVSMPIGGPAIAVAPANAGFSIERAVNRMIRAVRLERGVFEEVQFDPAAMSDAITAVAIVSVASGIGQLLANPRGGLGVLLLQVVNVFIGWFLWSYLVYFIGVKAFGGRGTANQMLRTMGLAYTPGIAGLLLFIPFLGGLLLFAAFVWDVVVGVVAVRTTLDFDTGRAIATVVLAFAAAFVVVFIFALVLVAALSAAR
ncbi:MAG: zinc-ribbon domain-containing protein [Chloroflexi bacterium]|nr:zinc-ribbon domain-containing protein [Chloroflexota bacterium]MBV9135001.1 zinc-ribbon domain-containing protein [Chloroflexota bacterium]MBV9898873.1 zinc-ribbon domain-containing protein [Chloroflexota bacterium]